jgi:hypothetical protein
VTTILDCIVLELLGPTFSRGNGAIVNGKVSKGEEIFIAVPSKTDSK